MDEIQIIVRPSVESDKAFVSSTWTNAVYFGSEQFREMPEEVFYRWFPRIINKILRRKDVEITIACDSTNPDWIVGCAAFDSDSLYWLYVKEDFRKNGVASLLIKDKNLQCLKTLMTITKPGRAIMEDKNLKYKPL